MENGDAGGVGGGRRRQHYASDNNNNYRTDSTHLRDFLRVKDDDTGRNNSLAGLTLGAVLTGQPQAPALTQSQSNRTLMDIIRDDPTATKESKKSWKTLKNKLRLRRAGHGASWTSTVPIPASDVPIQPNANRMISRRGSVRFPTTELHHADEAHDPTRPQLNSIQSSRSMLLRRNTSRIPERQSSRLLPATEVNISAVDDLEVNDDDEEGSGESSESPEGEAETGGGGEQQPQVRMSLMALLAETDREMGLDGTGYLMDDDDEDEEEEEETPEDTAGAGGEYNNCCVCMVRHKGSAFIPCGHTFCRLCSRELWVQRGNCPLCNNFILEILDIF